MSSTLNCTSNLSYSNHTKMSVILYMSICMCTYVSSSSFALEHVLVTTLNFLTHVSEWWCDWLDSKNGIVGRNPQCHFVTIRVVWHYCTVYVLIISKKWTVEWKGLKAPQECLLLLNVVELFQTADTLYFDFYFLNVRSTTYISILNW